jgi:hypothetical protein
VHIAQQVLLNSHGNILFKDDEYGDDIKAVCKTGMPALTPIIRKD